MQKLQPRPDGSFLFADIHAIENPRNRPESAPDHSEWSRVHSNARSAATPARPTPTAIPPAPDATERDHTWRRLLPIGGVRLASYPASPATLQACPDRAIYEHSCE